MKSFLSLLAVLALAGAVYFILRGPPEQGFMSHAHCYMFNRPLMWLHGSSDLVIGFSYVAISCTLTWLVVSVRKSLPFHWMMLAFALFIIACGTTHFIEVWTLQAEHPRYWLAGVVKLLTALASVITAILLPPLIPKVRSLLEHARASTERKERLETAYTELEGLYKKVKQLDELKTSFFANVSHELRTPLTLISAPLERLMKGPVTNEMQMDLRMMRRNTLLLHKYVNDLLDVSKIEAGAFELNYSLVNLSALARFMESVFDSTLSDQRVNLAIVAPDEVTAQVDGDKVQRIVMNLLANALNYTPRDGKVLLTVRQEGGMAELLVEDSGPGVDPAFHNAIFERFQMGDPQTRKRFGGSGLGLSIVKEFVQHHKGTVEVRKSEALGGAAFLVRLPLTAPAGRNVNVTPWSSTNEMYALSGRQAGEAAVSGTDAAEGAEKPAQAGRAPLILVVEDNWDMSEFICRVLSNEGCVLRASNGREGLRLAGEQPPDLIVTDVMMPEMTGDELVAELRKDPRLEDVPVLVLTARPAEDNQPSLLMQGAQDYVTKPFLVEELRARVHNLLTAKLTRDTLQREVTSRSRDLKELASDLAARARDLEEANQAKDHFLAVLSHELRTPLTPALNAARMLETTPEIEAKERVEWLTLIRRNIELEARLVDDLLDFTGILKGKLQLQRGAVDLHETVKQAVSMCGPSLAGKNLEFKPALDAPLHQVWGDAARLAQVVWNILFNAVKFTPPGGRVTITTSNPVPGRVRLEISDTGIGMDQDLLPQIFEPFRQAEGPSHRQYGGLGLGLSVAKGLVVAHGGSITASSQGLGKGATISIELDLSTSESSAPAPAAPAAAPAASGQSLRILVVEDHADTRRVMGRLLKLWGHEPTTAGSVAEGLAAAKEGTFDVLLSDVGLPDGTGMDLLQAMGGIRPPYAVALSGHGMPADFERSRKAGFLQHLTKPVQPERLKELLLHFVSELQAR